MTPSQYLFDTCLSVEILSFFLLQSWQILDSWWIDRECSWTRDSFLIAGGSNELLFLCLCFVPRHLLDSFICRCCFSWFLPRQMARHLYLSRITEDLYKGQARSGLHFLSISLSIPLSSHLPNHFRSIQTTFQVIFNLFEGFSLLGMFLISHFLSFKT